jgi:hypothetical protein
MIQQTTIQNVQAPRVHPKKRKFDLSELEDDHQVAVSSSVLTSTNVCNTSTSHVTIGPTVVYHKSTADQNQNGNQHHNIISSATAYNPHLQVVKNTGEVQQFIKRQFTNYR